MPGDAVEDHPMYVPPNPWMRYSYTELREMLAEGIVPLRHRARVLVALDLMEMGSGRPTLDIRVERGFGHSDPEGAIFDDSFWNGLADGLPDLA